MARQRPKSVYQRLSGEAKAGAVGPGAGHFRRPAGRGIGSGAKMDAQRNQSPTR